jgi:hypothetical protein
MDGTYAATVLRKQDMQNMMSESSVGAVKLTLIDYVLGMLAINDSNGNLK